MKNQVLDNKGKPITEGDTVIANTHYKGVVKEIRPAETEYHDDAHTAITRPPQVMVDFNAEDYEYFTAVSTMKHYNDPVEYCFEELEVVQ